MSEQSPSSNQLERKRSALLQILKATTTLPAQVTFYVAALGAIALMVGVDMPPDLTLFAGGVGANVLSSILERVARGELTDEEIRRQVQAVMDESGIAKELTAKDTQIMIARLFRRFDVLKFAIQESEYEIFQRLEEQARQYEMLIAELSDYISVIHAEIQKLARRHDEVIEPLQRLLAATEADKPSASYSTRINYRGEIAYLINFYMDYYVGRFQEEQDMIDLASQQTPGYILIKAQPGYGKSAFVSHLIKQREDGQWKEDCYPNLLYFFVRSHGLQNTPQAFLQALNAQIIDILQLSNQPVYTELDGLRAQFSNLWPQLLAIANSEQPLVLLIDGLDEMAIGPITIADLLPSNLSLHVHVVVTSRPNPDPLEQVPLEHPLRRAHVRTLQTFSEAEVEDLLKEYSLEPDKAAIELAPRILSITRGEPLFARFVCQEVVESGEAALTRLEHDPPDGVKEYFRQQLHRLKVQAEGDTIWDILGLMVAAYLFTACSSHCNPN